MIATDRRRHGNVRRHQHHPDCGGRAHRGAEGRRLLRLRLGRHRRCGEHHHRRSLGRPRRTPTTGARTHGDGDTVDLSATAGVTSDRGSSMFSGGFFDQQPVMAGDRRWSNTQLDYDWNGNVTKIRQLSRPEGRVLTPNLPGTTAPGSSYTTTRRCLAARSRPTGRTSRRRALPPVQRGSPAAVTATYNFQPFNYNVTPNRRVNMFAAGELKLSESVPTKAFFESSFTHRESAYQLAPEPLFTAPAASSDGLEGQLLQPVRPGPHPGDPPPERVRAAPPEPDGGHVPRGGRPRRPAPVRLVVGRRAHLRPHRLVQHQRRQRVADAPPERGRPDLRGRQRRPPAAARPPPRSAAAACR